MADKQTTQGQEEAYKEALREAYAVLVTLGKHCDTVEELVGMIGLAVGDEQNPGNDAQFRILLKLMKSK